MAAPQEGYPPQGYSDGQQSPVQPGFGAAGGPPGQPDNEGGKKKKRGYAAQAYDFGAGANSALGGQPPQGGAFQPAGAPLYGGYPQQPEAQPLLQPTYGGPQYGTPPGAPSPGAPAQNYGGAAPYGGGVGGYQPPDAGYPGPGAPAPGVAGITQGMGHMGMGAGAQPAAQPQQAASRPAVLNQLYPTDLLNQPFNSAELELPPPPIILPPNVSYYSLILEPTLTSNSSRVLPLRQMPIVLQNMFVRLLMLSQPLTRSLRNRSSHLRLLSSHIHLYMMLMTQYPLFRIKSFHVAEDAGPTSIHTLRFWTMGTDGGVICATSRMMSLKLSTGMRRLKRVLIDGKGLSSTTLW
jgi:hypothetical protein